MTPPGEKLAGGFSLKSPTRFPAMCPLNCCWLFARGIVAFILLLWMISSGIAAQKNPSSKRTKVDPSAEFFADRKVRLIDIELTEPARMALRTNPRSYIVGNVREGTQVFTNVGIHLKGMGSFRRLDEKPSFVLKFDKFLPD